MAPEDAMAFPVPMYLDWAPTPGTVRPRAPCAYPPGGSRRSHRPPGERRRSHALAAPFPLSVFPAAAAPGRDGARRDCA